VLTEIGVLGPPPPRIALGNITRNDIPPPDDNNPDGAASISVSSSHSRVPPGTIASNRRLRSTNSSNSFLEMMRLQMISDVQQRRDDKEKSAELQAEKNRVRENRLEDEERRREDEERARTDRREEEDRAREERREENKTERRHMQKMFMMVLGDGINAFGVDNKHKKRKSGNRGNQRGSYAEESFSSDPSSSTNNSNKDSKMNHSPVYDLYQDQK